jgi:hypothetical protein
VVALNGIERAREPKLKYNTGLAALQIGKNKGGYYNTEMHLAFVNNYYEHFRQKV